MTPSNPDSAIDGQFFDSPEFSEWFQLSLIPLWLEDFSLVKELLEKSGPRKDEDPKKFFKEHREMIKECASNVNILAVNPAACRLYRALNETELVEALPRLFTPRSWETFEAEIIGLLEKKWVQDNKTETLTLKGEKITHRVAFAVTSAYRETWKRILVSFHDTTAEDQALTQKAAAEIRFRSLFEGNPDGIIIHSEKGDIFQANPSAQHLLGYTEKELCSQNIKDLHPPGALEKSLAAFTAIEMESRVTFFIPFRRKDGTVFSGQVSSRRLPGGNPRLIIGTLREATKEDH